MDLLYDGVANASADEITKIRAELPKVETAAMEEITKIQAVLPDVQDTAVDETAKIKAQLPIVEDVAVAEAEKIQSELPKVASVTTDEITKIKAELPKVQTVATEEIGKIRDVLPTVEDTAQEVSDHADQKIAEYDAKFVSTDQKMAELEQSQVALDAELKATQQQIIDADVYTKAETDANTAMILDARNLSPAWSWSPDGTDRFTTVYPGENLVLSSKLDSYAPHNTTPVTVDGGRAITTYYVASSTDIQYVTLAVSGFTTVAGQQYTFSGRMTINGIPVTKEIFRYRVASTMNPKTSTNKFSLDANGNFIITETYVASEWIMHMGFTGIVAGDKIVMEDVKFELGDTATVYTPSPSEDYANAYPKYKGLRLAPSDNPSDYDWSYTDEYVDYLKSSFVSKTEFNDLAARLAALENKEV